MFEKASRLKLRFKSDKGLVPVEDLWALPLSALDKIAIALNKQIKEADEVSFLNEKSSADTETKLKFDIVLHILNTKKAEIQKRQDAAKRAEKKQELLELLSEKEKESMKSLSAEDIKKKIAELDS